MRVHWLLLFSLITLSVSAQTYKVDASWPQALPNNQILGQVSGIAVAGDDTIWVLHRPKSLTTNDLSAVLDPPLSTCCRPAPAVLQFNQQGDLLQAWGGPVWNPGTQSWELPVQDWPMNEHGIFVDDEGFVWIGGNQGSYDGAGGRHQVVKYTPSGEHVLSIGVSGVTAGSNDQERLGRPADIAVDVQAQEVYIADGYLNRRIVVFDSDTGAYKRHWGAYGNRPDDAARPPYQPMAQDALPDQFLGPVHAVLIGPDDMIYVADRTADRIQVFDKNGGFVREVQIAPNTLDQGSAWDLAISPLENHRWLFVADGSNRVIWQLERENLAIVGSFGQGGRQAGQFDWLHNIDVDASGNIYTAEVNNGRRIQKFSPTTP